MKDFKFTKDELIKNKDKYCFLVQESIKDIPYDYTTVYDDIDEAIEVQKLQGGNILVFEHLRISEVYNATELYKVLSDYFYDNDYLYDFLTSNASVFKAALKKVSECFGSCQMPGQLLGVLDI